MESKKRALGMGLEQLFNNENLDLDSLEKRIYETSTKEEIIEVPISELRPNIPTLFTIENIIAKPFYTFI